MHAANRGWLWAALACFALGAGVQAAAAPLGEIAFRQAMRDLAHPFRLLCVAAHPDDEDGASLALHRYRHGVRTYAAIATRGEGGQNEIGPELYEALGVIRTREMQAAAEITGSELLFLDLPEFGFSKNIEETFAIWGRENTLERVTRAIRATRPHVIITHHGRLLDHGHHQAIGRALIEAFHLAGDPEQFPEHAAAGLDPWQPWRLYIRAWEPSEAPVTLDISALDPLRGETYAEIAARALEAHASQGMEFFINRYLTGRPRVQYDLVETADPPSIPDAPAATEDEAGPLFAGLPNPAPEWLRTLSADPAPREALLPRILEALERVRDTQPPEAAHFEEVLERAAAAAADLQLRASSDAKYVVPGQKFTVTAMCIGHGHAAPASFRFRVESHPDFPVALPAARTLPASGEGHAETAFTLRVPDAQPPTLPHAEHLFSPDFLEPQLTVVAEADVDGVWIPVRRPLRLEIAPPVYVAPLDGPYLALAGAGAPIPIDVRVTHYAPGGGTATVQLTAPPSWRADPPARELAFAAGNEVRIARFHLIPDAPPAPGILPVLVNVEGARRQAEAALHVVDLALPQEARVGIVPSYDETLESVLAKLGVPTQRLDARDFLPETLDRFSTIFVDIRAYKDRPDLAAMNTALLDYAARGGTLIVHYHKTFEWREDFPPYPIRLSRNRVTQADAPVTLLEPEHPLFRAPNAIGAADWEGWIQERGLYFPDKWDPAYTPLLAMHDPGERIPPGSLLIAEHGAGRYVYTALVWYRQWRELHPGALRMLANMLAL